MAGVVEKEVPHRQVALPVVQVVADTVRMEIRVFGVVLQLRVDKEELHMGSKI
jgi:hypothetical protein